MVNNVCHKSDGLFKLLFLEFENPPASCQSLTDAEGSLSSPAWPQNYTDDVSCDSVINLPDAAAVVNLQFLDLNVRKY